MGQGIVCGAVTTLGHGIDELGRQSKQGDALSGGNAEQLVRAGVGGVAVVDDHRGRRGQCRHQEVPHHPSRGGEPRDPVLWPYVEMQLVFGEVFEQYSAGAMHDAFGLTRGA